MASRTGGGESTDGGSSAGRSSCLLPVCRAKQLLEEPYTQKTAEAAAGLGVWTETKVPKKKKKASEDVDMS